MIELVHDEVAAGGVLVFSLSRRTQEAGSTGPNIAWLVWRTQIVESSMVAGGRVFEDYRVVDTMRLEAGSEASPCEFRMPEQGPVSYEGKLFRLAWEVVVGTQLPGGGPQPMGIKAFRVVAGRIPSLPPTPA